MSSMSFDRSANGSDTGDDTGGAAAGGGGAAGPGAVWATLVPPAINDAEVAMTGDDASWIITNAFIIFTMQTGFGLLESACVSRKNEVNIMVKNVVDIVFGGLTYWMFGYGLSFGAGPYTTPFCGIGSFFLDTVDSSSNELGTVFTTFIFQLSFATTATTIVSGAMAERCNFNAYCIFSFLNTVVYCVPAGWLWGDHGFLKALGVIDIAGSGGVHLVGGVSALVSAAMLGPRHGRYDNGTDGVPMGCPTNAVLGLFVLWWGWLSFNCGSTFGVTNHRWKYAARAACSTLTASFGGGVVGMFYSYFTKHGKWDVGLLINSILSALVAVTAGCSLYHPWEGIVVGVVSAIATCVATPLIDKMHVDDPVGAVAVHAVGGVFGLVFVGLFPDNDKFTGATGGLGGLFKGGGWYMLGIQSLAVVCLAAWAGLSTFIILFAINLFVPIRMTVEEEILGADVVEHDIYLDGHAPPHRHGSSGKVTPSSHQLATRLPHDNNAAAVALGNGHREDPNKKRRAAAKRSNKTVKLSSAHSGGCRNNAGPPAVPTASPAYKVDYASPKFAWVNGIFD